MMNLDPIIDKILKNEGGFQRWVNDRGNYFRGKLIGTNRGITPARLAEWRGVDDITVEDMKGLTEDEARAIYADRYYHKPKIERLPDFLEEAVMDFYVTSGAWAIKRLQRMLTQFGFECDEDGGIGPQTVRQAYACAEAVPEDVILSAYYEARCDYYRKLAVQNAGDGDFIKGWLSRAAQYDPRRGYAPQVA